MNAGRILELAIILAALSVVGAIIHMSARNGLRIDAPPQLAAPATGERP